MSQYILKGKHPQQIVMFGWDSMLETFFAHITDKSKAEDDRDYNVCLLGFHYREIKTLDPFMHTLRSYITIPDKTFHRYWLRLGMDKVGLSRYAIPE